MAFQCPEEGGTAVYRARGLYLMHQDTLFNDSLLCLGTPPRNTNSTWPGKRETLSEKFTLYPNPVTSNLTIVLDRAQKDDETVMVEIFSPSGILVKRERFITATGILDLNVNDLPKGLYWCNLSLNAKQLGTEKFVIVR